MPLIVSGISKRSKEKWVLKDVSLEVAEGSIYGVFGPAASGKSALLRILAGQDGGFSGSFSTFNGKKATTAIPPRTVLVGRQTRLPRILDLFRPNSADSHAEGTTLLPLISDAGRSDADVILLDNVLCRLDTDAQAALFDELSALTRAAGKTVILSSHFYEDILKFCDEAAVISSGQVLQAGTAENIYLEPATAEVARLTGRNNIFEARRLTSSKSDTPEFQTIDGSHRLTVKRISKDRLGPLNQNMLLSIRPEHVSISFGASFPEDNLLKAQITGVKFLGPNTLVNLDAGGLRISALVMRLVGLNPGDECMLGMPPERIAVFDR